MEYWYSIRPETIEYVYKRRENKKIFEKIKKLY